MMQWWQKIAEFPSVHREMLEQTLCLIPLFPFVGFLLNGLFGRRLDRRTSGAIAVFAALAAFVWAFLCVQALGNSGNPHAGARNALHVSYGTWLDSANFTCAFGLYLDQLSAVMVLVVTGVGMVIHLYSVGYMAHDAGVPRYFAYLNLFLFAMLLLVLGDNLLLLFVGWEGVGLCSYLLIGFWYEDERNAAAGMKAFIVNRIGDVGFVLGILTLIALFGTANFVAPPANSRSGNVTPQTTLVERAGRPFVQLPPEPGLLDYGDALRELSPVPKPGTTSALMAGENKLPAQISNLNLSGNLAQGLWPGQTLAFVLTLACVLLFIGAIGKSAQIPLYVWLPDAMAGPTPVSALIHAATMVTAGVYMVCRLYGLFALCDEALRMIALIGGATALFSALIGLTQLDIKRVLAYSTVSQLGYMFLGLGAGAFSLGMFHLVTHAFFKALLFLGAGSVIHALSGQQDMRYMGGLRRKLPITHATMLIGAAALAGVPFFSGWYSKDALLLSTLERYQDSHDALYLWLYVAAIAAAFCTAFYTCRLVCVTFYGENRSSEETQAHIHESPLVMLVPLVVLAAFALIGGKLYDGMFTDGAGQALGVRNVAFGSLDAEALAHAHHVNLIATSAVVLAGLALAWFLYGHLKRVPDPARPKNFLYRLSFNKFYVDETYHWLFVVPFTMGAEIIHWFFDVLVIDTAVVGTGYFVSFLSNVFRRVQTGVVNHYALAILSGTLLVLLYLLAV